jgi:hypothetical protein
MQMLLMLMWSFIIRAILFKNILLNSGYVIVFIGLIALTYSYSEGVAPDTSTILIKWME